jgi:uncharacterized protein (DUF3820 family)
MIRDSEYQITFGKYKDTLLQDVPANYLLWLYDQEWLEEKYPELYDYIEENYTILNNEARKG